VQNGVSLLILAGIVVTTVLQSVPAVVFCASMLGGGCRGKSRRRSRLLILGSIRGE